jgi:hypothetical protein
MYLPDAGLEKTENKGKSDTPGTSIVRAPGIYYELNDLSWLDIYRMFSKLEPYIRQWCQTFKPSIEWPTAMKLAMQPNSSDNTNHKSRLNSPSEVMFPSSPGTYKLSFPYQQSSIIACSTTMDLWQHAEPHTSANFFISDKRQTYLVNWTSLWCRVGW